MERHTPFLKSGYYHVFNRGVDKRKIFFSDGDWEHFLKLLFLRNSSNYIKTSRVQGAPSDIWATIDRGDTLVDIVAYSFMPNHFHLLLHEKIEGGITQFMHKLLTAYSMYMNVKYNRTGPLMCRPFRAKYIDSDEYFQWIVSYIHLNPLELIEKDWKESGITDYEKAKMYIENYKYSSYQDYLGGTRDESIILNKDMLFNMVDKIESFKDMVAQEVVDI